MFYIKPDIEFALTIKSIPSISTLSPIENRFSLLWIWGFGYIETLSNTIEYLNDIWIVNSTSAYSMILDFNLTLTFPAVLVFQLNISQYLSQLLYAESASAGQIKVTRYRSILNASNNGAQVILFEN